MNQVEKIENSQTEKNASARDPLLHIKKMIQSCIQCGTCSGSCPNAFAMDFTPRKMWCMVLMNRKEEIYQSKTFILCSSCYYCTLRCPRGLPLTEAMNALKEIAAKEQIPRYKQTTLFNRCFIDSVRRHGRVRETEFMTHYFFAMKNPFISFRFAPLGIKLMMKRKLAIQIPSKGTAPLEAIFKKVEEVENR